MSVQNAAGNAAHSFVLQNMHNVMKNKLCKPPDVATAIFDCVMQEVRILYAAGGSCDCWLQECSKCGGSYSACILLSSRI